MPIIFNYAMYMRHVICETLQTSYFYNENDLRITNKYFVKILMERATTILFIVLLLFYCCVCFGREKKRVSDVVTNKIRSNYIEFTRKLELRIFVKFKGVHEIQTRNFIHMRDHVTLY